MVPDIAVEDNDASGHEVRHGGRYAAEIEIKIFDFGGPITAERRFDAAAHHRAGLGETDGSGTRAEGGRVLTVFRSITANATPRRIEEAVFSWCAPSPIE
jgi:hypothetical protein